MAKPKHRHFTIWAWQVWRQGLYAKLGALGGMADAANTKIKPDWSWQGKLSLGVGDYPEWEFYLFEVKVKSSYDSLHSRHHAPHRIHLRCPHCYGWTPFGRLHQHILSKRCCKTAVKAKTLPATPSLRSAES